jgi:hypothetical protein
VLPPFPHVHQTTLIIFVSIDVHLGGVDWSEVARDPYWRALDSAFRHAEWHWDATSSMEGPSAGGNTKDRRLINEGGHAAAEAVGSCTYSRGS